MTADGAANPPRRPTGDRRGAAVSDTVWVPAVPLPFLGWRTDRCSCGAKFRGRGRKHAYEIHYRRAHQRCDAPEDQVMMSMDRDQARLLYEEVNADCIVRQSDLNVVPALPCPSGRPAVSASLRHRLWRLTRVFRKHMIDECGGSPYRPCGQCITRDWCLEPYERKTRGWLAALVRGWRQGGRP